MQNEANQLNEDNVVETTNDAFTDVSELEKSLNLEAFINDPSLILNDLKGLCKKHEVPFVDLLNRMGFTKKKLEFVVINKTIAEQIYILNRELSLIIYQLGLTTNLNTINIRFLLGEVTTKEEWLNLMDISILPYLAGYYKNGELDPDFLFRDANGEVINEKFDNMLSPLDEGEAIQEVDDAIENMENIDECLDEIKDIIESNKNSEETLDIINGEETVETVTKEQVIEAEKNTTPSDVMIDANNIE